MKIAFNPSTVAALITPPNNKDITFDLRGRNIFARGVKFCGTDTNTWRDIKINNVSIGSNTLDLRNGSNTTLTNTNGVVTINSTWRPVVDNLTSDSTTSSLSAKQGKILKSLIDGKSNSGHTHDDRYLKLTGGTMASNALITFADSGSWGTDKGPQGARGGLYWTGQSDYAKLYAEETAGDNLDLVIQFGDDNSNGLSIRNKANTQTSYISSSGVITTGTFKGNLDWSYITNKPSSYTPSAHTHAWNSLIHSSTTENQAILTNGKANGWKLYTLNISRWDNAANNAHSHANKLVLDGITSGLVNNWNTAYTFVNTITGTDTDKVINKWDEIVNFLAGITEDNKLNTLLNSKLSVYKLADNTNVGAIKNNGIYYSTSDASSGTLVNSPFNTGFTLINMTSLDNGDDLRRSRLAFNAYGEVKISNDRGQANTAETWYNVLTSKNSGISGSTIKLNGTSITVYSSSTADGRYVKKSGDIMSGVLTIDTTNFGALIIKRNDDANGASIQFRGKSSIYGYIGLNNSTKDKQFLRWNSDTSKTYTILDTSSTYTSNGKGVINGTTITQVDNAINSTNSTNARKLVNWYSARPTSLNTQFGDGSLRIFYATSSTTEGKPAEDSYILHLAWDNNGGWDTQLAVHTRSGKVSTRAQNSGTWQPWKTLAFTTDIPSSLKNPYSLTTFGIVYDGSAAKTVTTSTFISLVTEGTSTITDGTMLITSYASNSGFADTNAVNIPYKRKAIHLWEYIKAKTDSLYAAKSHNHDDRYLKLTGGTLTGDLYINTNLYGPARGNNPRNRYDAALYFFNCNSSTTSTYNFGLYLWDNEFQFTYRTSADNKYKGNSFTIQGSDGQVTFAKTPKVGSALISLNGHTHAYLPLSGGTMSGIIRATNRGGSWISGRDHCLIRSDDKTSYSYWSAILAIATVNGYWTLGHLGDGGERIGFNYDTDADYNAGRNNNHVIWLPTGGAEGTLALTSDIPTSLKNPHALTINLNGTSQGPYDGSAAKNINITPGSIGAATSEHNHDNRYLKLTGGTMQLGEGLKFHADNNYFGTNSDARIISLLDGNGKVCDGGLIIDERGTFEGKEYVTELLRIRDSEFKWKGSNILHSGNSYINGSTITINGSSLTVSKSDHTHNIYAANENYGGFTKSGRLPISGFYQSNASESGGNAPWSGWMHLINCLHSNTGNNYALLIAASFSNNNTFKIRVTNNNVNNAWRDIIHSGNIGSQTVANAYHLRINSANTWSTWYWAGLSGLPSWLWGSNDGTNMYVWNPSNFRVAYASSAGNADTVDGYHITNESRQVYKNYYTVTSPAGAWILIKFPAWNGYNEIVTISGSGDNRGAHCVVHCGSRNQGIWGYQSDYNGKVVDRIRWKEVDSGKFALVVLISEGITNLSIKSTNSLEISKTTEDTNAFTITSNFFSSSGVFHGNVDWDKIIGKPSSFTPSAHNHDGRYLRLDGSDTMTGVLKVKGNQYNDGYDGAINMNNSDIYGLNSIYTADKSDTQAEGIHFWRDSTHVDTLRMMDGKLLFTPNRPLRGSGTEQTVLHTGNSYIKGGVITINGSSLTPLTSLPSHTHTYIVAEDLRAKYPGLILDPQRMKLSFLSASTLGIKNDGSYYDVITVRSYADSSGGSDNALLFSKNSNSLYHTRFAFGSTSSWGSPLLIIDSGNIGSQSVAYASKAGSVAWDSITGKPSSFTPSAHTHSWTSITDKLVAGNEFNIVNAGFNAGMWFNYLPINDRNKTATITGYHFGNGATGYTSINASGFIKKGSNSNYVLLGDGGHKLESSLRVAYASNADMVDGYHATDGRTFTGNINWSSNWNDTWSDGTHTHPWYGFDHRYPNTGAYSTTITDFFGMTIKTANTLRLDFGTLLLNGTSIYSINVASATKLQTARSIWGHSFNGTADVNGTIYINNSDSSNGAIRLNNNVNSNARISAIGNQVIFNTGNAIRFGETAWDWNVWAGLKYTHSNKTIYLGIADNSIFNANSALSGGSLRFPGISNVYATTFNGSLSGNASTATNADKLDGTHLNGIFTAFGNNGHNITATIGGVTKSFLVNWAADSDKLDGYHENSFLRYRETTSIDLENTLWDLIGIKLYNGALPDNLTNVYNYGSVISLPCTSTRFEIYASELASLGNGLYYRSGWRDTKRPWLKFIDSSNIGSQSVNYANSAGNADKLDGIHASGLLTSVTNSNNGISITVGGTTKSVSNISVNYANSAGSATKIIVNLHTTNDTNYPLVWSNLSNTNSVTENQLYKSWSDLYYNPKNKRLTVGGSVVASSFVKRGGTSLQLLRADGGIAAFNWSGQSGLPSWLWGGNNEHSYYVYNPSNFRVAYATSAGSADTALYLRSLGNLNCQTGRTLNYGDVYTYNTYANNTGAPTSYTSVIGFGRGIAGTVEIAGGWDNTNLYWRSLRDCCEDWHSWRTVLDSSNYTEYINNYYWANVKISASSSTTTSPTVSNLTATSSIRMGNIYLLNTNEINSTSGIHLNYQNSGNISLCYGGGKVGIGTTSPTYKLDVNGLMRASGFHHSSINSDNYILLAGGGYKSFGGDSSHPVFLGYLNLDHGSDGTISSSFYCLGYSVSFTYTRGGNYCKISIPDTTHQTFYIKAATASVNYSGGGMDTWTGNHRGAGAWWLHCYAPSSNEVRVKGFHLKDTNNDSWWGGNPLWSDRSGVNRITVCIFGYVTFR